MKSTETITRDVWRSIIFPEISTYDPHLGEVLEWADDNSIVWKIVHGTKSKVFGKHASHYFGCEQGDGEGKALSRASSFRRELERENQEFFRWRAHFTLEHYAEKGFTGGLFQQFDGSYPRGCHYLDYTPSTLEAVIDRFYKHCDESSCRYETREIWIDKSVVRTVGGPLTFQEKEASKRERGRERGRGR